MFQLANLIMNGKTFLGQWEFAEQFVWVQNILDAINFVLVPIMAVVAGAGIIWAIVLGVQMARADSQDKRDESKKRLISLIVGIVIVVVLIVFFLSLFPMILRALIPDAFVPHV